MVDDDSPETFPPDQDDVEDPKSGSALGNPSAASGGEADPFDSPPESSASRENDALVNIGADRLARVIGLAQTKGGVGVTTLCAAIGSSWARQGLKVVLVDLDDVTPALTMWAAPSPAQYNTLSDIMRVVEPSAITKEMVRALLVPVHGSGGDLLVLPQPKNYNEAFHFKANILEDALSISDLILRLFELLREECDLILVDMGRTWGLASFAALYLVDRVVHVIDDDALSLKISLATVERLARESDDPDEFDFKKWDILLNGYSGKVLTPKQVASAVERTGVYHAETRLHVVPFSARGRSWIEHGKTLYDLGEREVQKVIEEIGRALL